MFICNLYCNFNQGKLAKIAILRRGITIIFIKKKSWIGCINRKLIKKKIFKQYIKCKMLIPYDQGRLVSYLNDNAHEKRSAIKMKEFC